MDTSISYSASVFIYWYRKADYWCNIITVHYYWKKWDGDDWVLIIELTWLPSKSGSLTYYDSL